jgi:YbgC/YbaW family acyl-CoA thioester hydrolase
MYGHVNHATYLTYLEYARIEFLRAGGILLQDLSAKGYYLVIAQINITYKKPAFMDDNLEIKTKFLKSYKVGGIFLQTIVRKDEEIAEAEVKWVCANPQGSPIRLPDAMLSMHS